MADARDVVKALLTCDARIRVSSVNVLKLPWLTVSREKLSKSKMMRVLQNVLLNTCESPFKKFLLRVIAEDIQPETLEIVGKAFRIVDKNGDGNLEVKEIRRALKKYGEEEDEADAIFEAIDRDASGTLNFAEFTAVSIGRHEYTNAVTLWNTFNRFDNGNKGSFDKPEIARVVGEIQHLSPSEELDAEVGEIVQTVNLPMDFDAFVNLMLAPLGENPNSMNVTWDRMCYNLLKVDNHKVRHLTPKRTSCVNLMKYGRIPVAG